MQHLLTHVSGLPDQLPENNELRRKHASLAEFAEHAMRTPLQFVPGSKYQYSSMAILLATRVAELLGGTDILQLVDRDGVATAQDGALGPGAWAVQAGRHGAGARPSMRRRKPAGAIPRRRIGIGTVAYWRKLGAPWGGAHASAPDLARFLGEFLHETGAAIKPETARLMVTNHNPAGLTPRGLGLDVGSAAGSAGCSEKTFGHTGSTGTIAWADPATQTICVVLTSLPARAVHPHPRDLAGNAVAASTR